MERKILIVNLPIVILAMLLIAGCGQVGNNNPVGATGGGDGGYGVLGNNISRNIDTLLIDGWTEAGGQDDDSSISLRFDADGAYHYEIRYYNSPPPQTIGYTGTFFTSGNKLFFRGGNMPSSGTYIVDGILLTLIFDEDEIYHYARSR